MKISSIFKDKNGNTVIAQWPNAPIILWFLFMVLANLPILGDLRSALLILSNLALIYWALLEITSGANLFRRFMGIVVFVGAILLIVN